MKAEVIGLVAVGIASAMLCQSCASYRDPATGEEAKYGFETLRATVHLEIGTVYAAARKATLDFRLKAVRAAEDGISGEIRAWDAQSDLVEVRLGALPENRTLLTIRVGTFGDRNKSLVLFERIMENLSEAHQVAAAPDLQWSPRPVHPSRRPER